jgi:hypothetical protein
MDRSRDRTTQRPPFNFALKHRWGFRSESGVHPLLEHLIFGSQRPHKRFQAIEDAPLRTNYVFLSHFYEFSRSMVWAE